MSRISCNIITNCRKIAVSHPPLQPPPLLWTLATLLAGGRGCRRAGVLAAQLNFFKAHSRQRRLRAPARDAAGSSLVYVPGRRWSMPLPITELDTASQFPRPSDRKRKERPGAWGVEVELACYEA